MIKSVLSLTAILIFPLSLTAQQLPAGSRFAASTAPAASVLPDAPLPQHSVPASEVAELSSSVQAAPAPQASTPQASTPQTPVPQAETPQDRHAEAEKELSEEEKQRMLGVIPNFNTVMSGEAAPIDAKEKFRLFFKSSIDPFQFVAAGVDAGIEQGEDSYPEYHQGIEGYAKRYGAAFADGFDGNFFGNAVLPSLLHQDPRYFRLGHGSFKRRLWYSIIANVRAKGDNGKWQPNYSNIAGNLIGGAISNVYYPAEDRGLGLTFERGFTVTAEGAIGSAAVEFYPDVISWWRRKHNKTASAAPITAPVATPTQP